jgi:acetyl esterase
MPLDPQTRVLLQQMEKANLTPYEAMTPQEARRQMAVGSCFMERPPEVFSWEDREIPGPAGQLRIRHYRPSADVLMPVVVFFHGGGWVMGSIETHDVYCRQLAKAAGYAVISVNYRLAPEDKFPAGLEDAYAAIGWVSEHAAEIGVDARRIAVAGDSAGGNLAAAVALLARDRGGPRLTFQLLMYPVLDCNFDTPSYRENATGYHLTRAALIWSWGHYLKSELDGLSPYASPLRAGDLRGLPAAMILTAEFDPLRDEGEAYAARLLAAGVPVELKRYDGLIHGFARRTNVLDGAREALQDVANALRGLPT